jgi:hypothetical protein
VHAQTLSGCELFSFEPLRKPVAKYRAVVSKRPSRTPIQYRDHLPVRYGFNARFPMGRFFSLLRFAQAQHDNYLFTEESGLETVSIALLSECLDPSPTHRQTAGKITAAHRHHVPTSRDPPSTQICST